MAMKWGNTRACDFVVHVKIDDRKFVVEFDSDGEVIRIKERKAKLPPMLGIYDVSYWESANHPMPKSAWSIPQRCVAAARKRLQDEHQSMLDTP
jgi:hypothetical protein